MNENTWMPPSANFLSPYSNVPNMQPSNGSPVPQEQGRIIQTGWQEPPLRQPQPSYMDHRGLERQGVLDGMYALGTKPNSKIRQRARADPLRRAAGVDGYGSESPRATPDGTNMGFSTRAASLRAEEQSRPTSPASDNFAGAVHDTYSGEDTIMQDYEQQVTPSRMAPQDASSYAYPEPPIDPSLIENIEAIEDVQQMQAQEQEEAQMSDMPVNTMPDPMRMEKAIVNANNRRPDLHPMITHLHSAILRDHDFAQLIAINASGNGTESQRKALSRKIGDLKRVVHIPNYTPRRIRSSKGGAHSSTIPTPETSRTNPATQFSNLSHIPSQSRPPNFSSPRTTLKLHLNPSATPTDATSPLKQVATQHDRSASMASDNQQGQSRRGSSSSLSSVNEEIAQDSAPGPATRANNRETRTKASSKKKPAQKRKVTTTEEIEGDEVGLIREAARKRLRRDFDDVVIQDSSERSTYGRDSPPDQAEPNASELATPGPSTAPGTGANGVAGPTNLGRPPKRRATKAKVINSPAKSREPVTAGRPGMRTLNTTNDKVGIETRSEKSDNNDYCEACGGQGFLLCCDGCDRAFHFTCCDPPLDTAAALDAPYYCHHCESKRNDDDDEDYGIFTELHKHLMKRNPEAFVLPDHIRFYFQGNATGEDGRYLDVPTRGPANNNNRPIPNSRQTREGEVNVRQEGKFCAGCGESSWPKGPSSSSGHHPEKPQRDIVPCDVCGLFWHTDCLSPPRANAPHGRNGNYRVRFTCPRHVVTDLHAIDPIANTINYGGDNYHRIRVPKRKRIIDPQISRGVRNNGNIEVGSDTDESGSEHEEVEDVDGSVYRIPRKALKLDFIHKAKMQKQSDEEKSYWSSIARRNRASNRQLKAANQVLAREARISKALGARQFIEGQAALNLMHFASSGTNAKLADDETNNLIYTLQAEATNDVARKFNMPNTFPLMTSGQAGMQQQAATAMTAEEERDAIRRLQATLTDRLTKLNAQTAGAASTATTAKASSAAALAPKQTTTAAVDGAAADASANQKTATAANAALAASAASAASAAAAAAARSS